MNLNPIIPESRAKQIQSILIWVLPVILFFYLFFQIFQYRYSRGTIIIGFPFGPKYSWEDRSILIAAGEYTFLPRDPKLFQRFCLGTIDLGSGLTICRGLSFESTSTTQEFYNQLDQ